MTAIPFEQPLRQALAELVAKVGLELAQGAPTRQVLKTLEEGFVGLHPIAESFRQADAEAWLETQVRALKPRKPRRTQGWIRRNGMAQRAAARAMAETGR